MLPNFESYILKLKDSKYSSETVYNYERDLNVFDKFLVENDLPFKNIDKRTITYYKEYLISRDRKTAILNQQADETLSSRSVNRMLSALRSYFRYLLDVDYPCPIPIEAIKLTKSTKKYQNLADFVALKRLIEAPVKFEAEKK